VSNTKERVDELLEDLRSRIEALEEEALAEIEKVLKDAEEKVAHYEDAAEELEQVEDEIASLEGRREELPVEVTRANLEEQFDLEMELREEYRSIQPRLDALGDRRGSLKEEMRQLNPKGLEHPLNIQMHQYSRVSGTAAEERRVLEHLRKQMVTALDDALDLVVKKHEDYRGLVEDWGRQRDWDPEFRDRLDKAKAAQGGGR
jgi:chromosome segregation ATPase